MTGAAAPRRWYQELSWQDRRAFLAAWLGYAMDGFDFVLITLVLTEIAREFELSTVTAATLVSAAFVSRWFGGLAIGAFGDRFGRRPAMVLSIVLYALGTALCGFAWNYWSLFAFRAVIGLGMAGEYTASATYVMESWPERMRNRASGLLLSGYPIGGVLAAKCYAWIVPQFGWRALFWLGIIPVALAVYLRKRLPEARDWQAYSSKERPVSAAALLFSGRPAAWNLPIAVVAATGVFFVLRNQHPLVAVLLVVVIAACFLTLTVQFAGRLWPVVVALMVTVFCAFLASWPLQSLLPTYLKTELHYGPEEVSDVLLYTGLGYAVGSGLTGFLGDRYGTRRAYVAMLLASLATVWPVFAFSGGDTAALRVLLFLALGVSQGGSGVLPRYISSHYPIRIRAAALGFSYNVGALGGAAAPVLGAALARPLGLGPAIVVLSLSLTSVAALLVGSDVPARVQQWSDSHRRSGGHRKELSHGSP